MKKNYLLLLLIGIISLASCKKTGEDTCPKIGARIIKYECDRVIFQLLTDQYAGDADWQDPQTGQHYSNVVSWYNTCAVAEFTNGRLDTIYVNVSPETTDPLPISCNQCLALPLNPPNTKVEMRDLGTVPCDSLMMH